MTWSEKTKHKLEMLIPRLSSEYDAEIVSTIRAIDKVITKEGKSWHDFTRSTIGTAQQSQSNAKHKKADSFWDQTSDSEWAIKARYCERHLHALRSRESDFICDMVVKLKWNSDLSPKQAAWLDSIYNRLLRENGEFR